ncbi:bifunctional hydroxymethylpyrimidine kinase/phosphomethylpyrimidine kinase [Qipengyuania atrilutea]|uniref:hydroxymethylpyrimidine kinase n=1 Tax=Qipengyuania atrilutea TaxID=2744473 RepID=A0A850GZH7_9SPHN|nr:bifunctional hydroxymethylpyrimidine kinase/phosphomethylpyrimidine kinase [Actirhodobacter atriluteus]NVD45064.1 bifunctional hydroxymethylpyrimidine kinase/phosphomethylpyrimidine kinase [Actirhodobacter atriluteus]
MSERKPPRILTIAGSDSSGGAGIQADLKTIAMLGGYGMSVVTSLTAQNTCGVQAIHPVPAEFVEQQFFSCDNDIGIDAIKIGMIGRPETARALWDVLLTVEPGTPVVFDPVMVATSGAVLADGETIAAFRELMDLATLVTPNLPELAELTEMQCDTPEQVTEAAHALSDRHDVAVLAKGGHGEGTRLRDLLIDPHGRMASFDDYRIDTPHTHGTGCTLSSAIATLLGHGQPLENAVRLSRKFVRQAILAAPGFGAGGGPLGHQAVRSLD